MRGLKFLVFLFLCFLALLAVAAWYNYDTPQALWADLSNFGQIIDSILEKIQFYFTYAGSWNYLILLLVAAVLMVLFVLNNLMLEGWIQSRKKKGFISGGFSWLLQRTLALVLVLAEMVLLINLLVWIYAQEKIIEDARKLEGPQTVLLLGTNKKLRTREGSNLYYTYRIEAVSELYRKGKIKRIIISGDNGRAGYNEPADMQHSLIRKGVPPHLIELDYAGFRTLDSIVRLKGHFKVQRALIVSQRFHIERALLLAWLYDVEAIGYPAEGSMTMAMAWRETMAKPKALLDVFIFNMQPRYGKTYAKASIDWQNNRDRNFAGLVLVFCSFAALMVFLFFRD